LVEDARLEAKEQDKELKIFFQDEARFGRIDSLRRCWAPKGIRPLLKKQIVREYTYCFGAVSPSDGDSCFLVLPKLNQNWMMVMLEEMAERYPNNYLLVVCDGASAHNIEEYRLPSNVRLASLPPYSPQLNPQENMWDDMREKFFHNIAFNSLDAVEDRLVTACNHYEGNPAIVKSISGWDWIVSC
jgi:transposase